MSSEVVCTCKGALAVTRRSCMCRTVQRKDATLYSLIGCRLWIIHRTHVRSIFWHCPPHKCDVGVPRRRVSAGKLLACVERAIAAVHNTLSHKLGQECVTASESPAGECCHARNVHVACISRSWPRASAISRTATGPAHCMCVCRSYETSTSQV